MNPFSAAHCVFLFYGALGDLVEKKLFAQLLRNLNKLPREERAKYRIVMVDVYKWDEKYLTTMHKRLVKNGLSDVLELEIWEQLPELLEFHHNCGDPETNRMLYARICDAKRKNSAMKLKFYFAVPYWANLTILEQIKLHVGNTPWGADCEVVFEKPAEITEAQVERLKALAVEAGIPQERLGVVEHFDRKPAFRRLLTEGSPLAEQMQIACGRTILGVDFEVTETIGTENRSYPGIGVDSLLNHHAYMMSAVFLHVFGWLERLRDTRVGDALSAVLVELNDNRVSPWGTYAICAEDHCAPVHKTPTGVHLTYGVTYKGRTIEVTSDHHKNTKTKMTKFRIRGTDWSFEVMIDGYRDGVRGYGWTFTDQGKVTSESFQALTQAEACGYADVMEILRNGHTHLLLTLDFQLASNAFFCPLFAQLDAIPDYERVWFSRGAQLVGTFDVDKLHDLEPKLSDPAVVHA